MNDTLVLGNYFYETSVNSSWSTRMSVIDNFFDVGRKSQGGGVGWYNRDVAPLRYGHMVLRGNAFVGTHMGYICGSDHGTVGMWPDGFARAMVDYNRVRVLPDDSVLFTPGYALKTLAEVQQQFGWDLHGEVKVFDRRHNDLTPEAMGGSTVTFRVPWGPRSHLARPMLADAKIDGRWPEVPEYAGDRMPAFFWRVASGNYDPNDLTRWRGYEYEAAWQPDCDAGYDLGDNRGAAWYVGAEDRYPDPKFSNPPANRASQSSGNRWLVMQCVKPEKMPPSGVGWWTPWLATAPGAKTTVSLKIYGKSIEPTEKGTPAVYVQFIGPTGPTDDAHVPDRPRRPRRAAPARADQGLLSVDGSERDGHRAGNRRAHGPVPGHPAVQGRVGLRRHQPEDGRWRKICPAKSRSARPCPPASPGSGCGKSSTSTFPRLPTGPWPTTRPAMAAAGPTRGPIWTCAG